MNEQPIDWAALEGPQSQSTPNKTDEKPIDWAALEPGASKSSAPPPGKTTGLLANIGAGINENIAGIAGFPVDATTWALNKGIHAVNATSGSDVPDIKDPIGGSESIKRGLGVIGANPDNVVPDGTTQKVARSLAGGAASFAVPGLGAEAALAKFGNGMAPDVRTALEILRGGSSQPDTAMSTLKNMAGNARTGAVFTGGSDAAQSAVPDQYKPIVGMAGGLGAGMGEAYFSHVLGHLMTPKTVENEAADRFKAGMSNPDAANDTLQNPSAPLPGAPSYSTGQVTNDAGILQMENWDRNQRPDVYRDRAAAQNSAQVNALQGVQPDGNPATLGAHFVDRLNKIDTAYGAVEDAARTHALDVLQKIGGGDAPETYGAQGRQAVSGTYQPQMDALDQALAFAQQQHTDAMAQAPGQQFTDVPGGSTAVQQHGQNLRQFVQEGRDARAAEEGRLWDVVRQNGDLTLDHQPPQQAVNEAVNGMQPAGGDRLTPVENQLYGTIKGWDQPQPLDVMRAMRSNIGDAADTAYRAGDRQAAARLRTVRGGIDQSIENGVTTRGAQEATAVQQGEIPFDQTMEAALQRDADQWLAARKSASQRPAPNVASAGQGAANPQPNGQTSIPGLPGAAGEAPQGRSAIGNNQGMAQAEGQVSPKAAQEAPSPEQLAADYATARASTRETHRLFDDTPAGKVIARGPYGSPQALPSSEVFSQFWNNGKHAPEDLANYQEVTRNDPQARAAMVDAGAYDLRQSAAPNGVLNPARYRSWVAKNQDKLLAMPEVADRFSDAATAQETVQALGDQRQALADRYQAAIGPSDATMMGQYWRPGVSGTDGVRRYMTETGRTPTAVEALVNHAASTLRDAAVGPDGQINPARYQTWAKRFAGGLQELPAPVRERFATAAGAQLEVQDAAAMRAEAVNGYQKSVAGLLMRTDDPVSAVGQALKGNAGVQNMRFLASQVRGDADAQAGLRRAVVEWLMDRAAPQGIAGKEAGNTGTDWVRNQTFRNVLDDNRAALSEALTPQQMKVLDQVAESLKITDRSVSGSKPPIGPGTARDLIANQKFGSTGQKAANLLSAVAAGGARVGSIVVGHYLGGLEGSLVGSAATSAIGAVRGTAKATAAAAREVEVMRLIQTALEDPQAARILLTKVTPQRMPFMVKNFLNRMVVAQTAQQQNGVTGAPP